MEGRSYVLLGFPGGGRLFRGEVVEIDLDVESDAGGKREGGGRDCCCLL